MKMLLAAGLAAASVLPAAAEQANFLNNFHLDAVCKAEPAVYSSGVCDGYILGVTEGYSRVGAFCIPEDAVSGQVIAAVKSRLMLTAPIRATPAQLVVIKSLSVVYPCD